MFLCPLVGGLLPGRFAGLTGATTEEPDPYRLGLIGILPLLWVRRVEAYRPAHAERRAQPPPLLPLARRRGSSHAMVLASALLAVSLAQWGLVNHWLAAAAGTAVGLALSALSCVPCRQCEEECPLGIPISEWMLYAHAVLGEGRLFDRSACPQ